MVVVAVLFDVVLLAVRMLVFTPWHVHHSDISTAILSGDIDVDLFLKSGRVRFNLKKCVCVWSEAI